MLDVIPRFQLPRDERVCQRSYRTGIVAHAEHKFVPMSV